MFQSFSSPDCFLLMAIHVAILMAIYAHMAKSARKPRVHTLLCASTYNLVEELLYISNSELSDCWPFEVVYRLSFGYTQYGPEG